MRTPVARAIALYVAASLATFSPFAFAEEPFRDIPVRHGSIRFTQGNRSATWALNEGDILRGGLCTSVSASGIFVSPDGRGLLALGWVVTAKGEWVFGLDIIRGPAGSAHHDSRARDCDVKVLESDESSLSASLTCHGDWEFGVGVSDAILEVSR